MKTKVIALAVLALTFFAVRAEAQTGYKTAVGLGIDFGEYSAAVGPEIKHFFAEHHVGQAELLFADHSVLLTALYLYHANIPNAPGLKWYAGGGPSISFNDDYASFFLRPTGGLDYKLKDVPINFSLDWRPLLYIGDRDTRGGTPARFGTGVRYTF